MASLTASTVFATIVGTDGADINHNRFSSLWTYSARNPMNKAIIGICTVLALAAGTAIRAQDAAVPSEKVVKVAVPMDAGMRGRILDAKGSVLDEGLISFNVAGLEWQFGKYLQSREVQAPPGGVAKPSAEKQRGYDLVLTIDSEIQKIADEEVGKAAKEWMAESVIAVMVDPKTGAILAAAQWPPANASVKNAKDYIFQLQFEPGSMMKGLTMAIALDKGIVTLDRKIDCSINAGLYRLADTYKLGVVAGSEVIQKSSNIDTARIALMMKPEELYKGFKDFGLGTATGVGIPNEYRGVLKKPADWTGPSHSRIPIGYEGMMTPPQIVQAYAVIANKGSLMQLRLVDGIRDPQKNANIYSNQPKEYCKVAGERAIADLVTAIKLTTQEGGTATKAAVPGYHVAGMAGTARKYADGDGYIGDRFICSFVGFVPADKPVFVLLVTVNDPSNGRKPYYGGSVAGPVFRSIADLTLQHLQVKQEFTMEPKR
jgi:cell division protein FtsI/penicillin-binding protein 2